MAGGAELILEDGAAGLLGRTVALPVSLVKAAGEDVAALQFDLNFDPSLFSFHSAVATSDLIAAGKTVGYSDVDADTVRFIVSGMNVNPIPDGTLLYVTLDVAATAEPGFVTVTPSALLASDPLGASLPITALPGTVELLLPVLATAGLPALAATALLALLLGFVRITREPRYVKEEIECLRR